VPAVDAECRAVAVSLKAGADVADDVAWKFGGIVSGDLAALRLVFREHLEATEDRHPRRTRPSRRFHMRTVRTELTASKVGSSSRVR
jgi:hypothetical protein